MRILMMTFALFVCWTGAQGETIKACYLGRDASNQPASMALVAERIGESFEIYGQVNTTGYGTFRVKADGWSGSGRMFRSHEYESGAVFIRFSDLSTNALMFHVDGFGSFPFQAVAC